MEAVRGAQGIALNQWEGGPQKARSPNKHTLYSYLHGMMPLIQLVKEHIKLVRTLRHFSFADAAQLTAGLSLWPGLHANTIRLELLQHLVVISCVGEMKPSRDDLIDWAENKMRESIAAKLEEPVEDTYNGCENSEYGTFRILTVYSQTEISRLSASWRSWRRNKTFLHFKLQLKVSCLCLRSVTLLLNALVSPGTAPAKVWRQALFIYRSSQRFTVLPVPRTFHCRN